MRFLEFTHSMTGRLMLIGLGAALLWCGALHPTFWGLMLMMVGLLPLVVGVSNESPLDGMLGSMAPSPRRDARHRVPDHHA